MWAVVREAFLPALLVVGDGVTLATTMRQAISATHVTPGT
jgi:hypothetical protein